MATQAEINAQAFGSLIPLTQADTDTIHATKSEINMTCGIHFPDQAALFA